MRGDMRINRILRLLVVFLSLSVFSSCNKKIPIKQFQDCYITDEIGIGYAPSNYADKENYINFSKAESEIDLLEIESYNSTGGTALSIKRYFQEEGEIFQYVDQANRIKEQSISSLPDNNRTSYDYWINCKNGYNVDYLYLFRIKNKFYRISSNVRLTQLSEDQQAPFNDIIFLMKAFE